MNKKIVEKLSSLSPKEVLANIQDNHAFSSALKKLGLPPSLSKDQFVEYLLNEAASLLNEEKRKEALRVLRFVKHLLSITNKRNKALFYLTLANSFITANDYVGAEKAIKKALVFIDETANASLKVKALNLQFVVARTLKKPEAEQFLVRSRDISLKHELYENVVFCEVNLGLIAFFKKDHKTAMRHLKETIRIIETYPYPKEKLIMPCDFFLQVLSENSGYVRVPKYHDIIFKGVNIVLSAIDTLESPHQGAKRLSLLVSFLKLSDDLLSKALEQIEKKIVKVRKEYRAIYYSGVASGLAEYKGYKIALNYFEKAITNSSTLSDHELRELKKKYAFTLSMALGIKMLYDLSTTSNLSYRIKRIQVKTDDITLIGKKDTIVTFRNAVADSDAIFTADETFIKKSLYGTLKNFLNIKRTLTYLGHEKSRQNLIEKIDAFVINALSHEGKLISILFVGSNIKERPKIVKNKNNFSTYQILGHFIPNCTNCTHIEEYDVKFLYTLLKKPQKFRKIEILVPSEKIEKGYKTIL